MRKGTKFVSIFGSLALVPTLAACGGSAGATPSYYVPKKLVGQWYQTNKLDSGVIMQGSVNLNDTIQVNMKTRDSSSIYWMGSFESSKSSYSNFEVKSKGDPDAMAMSIFGSQDTTKKFKYKNGELTFKFTMMGTTSTIHLRQHKPPSTRSSTRPTNTPAPTRTANVPGYKAPAPKKTADKPKTQPPVKVPAAPAPAKTAKKL